MVMPRRLAASRLTFVRRQPLSCQSLLTSARARQGFEFIHQLRHAVLSASAGGLQRELVLRAADLGIDGQILNRLRVQLNARHAGDGALRPLSNPALTLIVALIQRQVDLQTRC